MPYALRNDTASGVRKVMRAGAAVFAFSAVVLLFLPALFADLLGLDSSQSTVWALRMIGIVLIALSAGLFVISKHVVAPQVRFMALVMIAISILLSWLTFQAPGPMTWFRWVYVFVGAGFGIAYVAALARRR